MFDVSVWELLVTGVVALFALRPADMRNLLESYNAIAHKLRCLKQEYISHIYEELDCSQDSVTHYVMDIDGKMRAAYDVNDILPKIREDDG